MDKLVRNCWRMLGLDVVCTMLNNELVQNAPIVEPTLFKGGGLFKNSFINIIKIRYLNHSHQRVVY